MFFPDRTKLAKRSGTDKNYNTSVVAATSVVASTVVIDSYLAPGPDRYAYRWPTGLENYDIREEQNLVTAL